HPGCPGSYRGRPSGAPGAGSRASGLPEGRAHAGKVLDGRRGVPGACLDAPLGRGHRIEGLCQPVELRAGRPQVEVGDLLDGGREALHHLLGTPEPLDAGSRLPARPAELLHVERHRARSARRLPHGAQHTLKRAQGIRAVPDKLIELAELPRKSKHLLGHVRPEIENGLDAERLNHGGLFLLRSRSRDESQSLYWMQEDTVMLAWIVWLPARVLAFLVLADI